MSWLTSECDVIHTVLWLTNKSLTVIEGNLFSFDDNGNHGHYFALALALITTVCSFLD